MTQSVNYTSPIEISQSMMTFREYYMSFIEFTDNDLENGWGWFVDIELNFEPAKIIQHKNKNKNKNNCLSKYLHIPQTIKEYHSIRSRNSMSNLHESSMIFQMDDDDDNKNKTSIANFIYINTICIILMALIFYYIY